MVDFHIQSALIASIIRAVKTHASINQIYFCSTLSSYAQLTDIDDDAVPAQQIVIQIASWIKGTHVHPMICRLNDS